MRNTNIRYDEVDMQDWITHQLEWIPEEPQHMYQQYDRNIKPIKSLEHIIVEHHDSGIKEEYVSIIQGAIRYYAYNITCMQEDPDVITMEEFHARMKHYINNSLVTVNVL